MGRKKKLRYESISNEYQFLDQLGLGSYGEVRLARHKRSKFKFAIKKIPIDKNDKDSLEMINNEISTLMRCVKLLLNNQ